MRSCHNSLIKSSSPALGSSGQRTPEEGSCARHFRWEQGPNGRRGCVRDLMPSAQYYHFSFDCFFLSPYTVICFLLSHLCSFHFSCFLPSLPLKKESLFPVFFFLHPPLPVPAVPHLLSLFKNFPSFSDSLMDLPSSSSSAPTALNPLPGRFSSFLCLLFADLGWVRFTSLRLSRLLFLQHFRVGGLGVGVGGAEYNITSELGPKCLPLSSNQMSSDISVKTKQK